MPLTLAFVELADFTAVIEHATRYAPGDDLIGPPVPTCWPVKTEAEALDRLKVHMARQRERFLQEKSATFVKVVDVAEPEPRVNITDEGSIEAHAHGEIISIARWHYYPHGYDYNSERYFEVDGKGRSPLSKVPWPAAMNFALHDHILTTRDAGRLKWIDPAGSPCLILMHMVTRMSHRGRGAAGMIIRWGIAEAERLRCPAYLEAGAQGAPVYEKYGFVKVGNLVAVELGGHGGKGVFTLARMAYYPKSRG